MIYPQMTIQFDEKTMTASMKNIGIVSIKKEAIRESLAEREKNAIDPFNKGFNFDMSKIVLGNKKKLMIY